MRKLLLVTCVLLSMGFSTPDAPHKHGKVNTSLSTLAYSVDGNTIRILYEAQQVGSKHGFIALREYADGSPDSYTIVWSAYGFGGSVFDIYSWEMEPGNLYSFYLATSDGFTLLESNVSPLIGSGLDGLDDLPFEIPEWTQTPECLAFLSGLFLACTIRLFRACLRWFKRVGSESSD